MTIDIISDLHIDFYFKDSKQINKRVVLQLFDRIFRNKQSDILIIPGDLGHNNQQITDIIKIIKDNYYEHIICVLGNHDYYLLSKNQSKKYLYNSLNRVKELRTMLNDIVGVDCLDGTIIEIDGIKFGGCDSWYDGSYYSTSMSNDDIVKHWKSTMNDAKYIKGIDNFYDLVKIEQKKLDNIYLKSDVIITHISPSINNLPNYNDDDKSNGYYTFNGEDYLSNTTAKYWIFGHIHQSHEYEEYEVKCLSNPLGYPKQSKDFSIKTIEIK